MSENTTAGTVTGSALTTVVFPVRDLEAAKTFFTALLGAEPSTDSAWYVGYDVGGQQVGLDPNGHAQGMTGPVPYRVVPDVEAAVAALVAAGGTVKQEPREVGGGRTIATVEADGNVVGVMHDA